MRRTDRIHVQRRRMAVVRGVSTQFVRLVSASTCRGIPYSSTNHAIHMASDSASPSVGYRSFHIRVRRWNELMILAISAPGPGARGETRWVIFLPSTC